MRGHCNKIRLRLIELFQRSLNFDHFGGHALHTEADLLTGQVFGGMGKHELGMSDQLQAFGGFEIRLGDIEHHLTESLQDWHQAGRLAAVGCDNLRDRLGAQPSLEERFHPGRISGGD